MYRLVENLCYLDFLKFKLHGPNVKITIQSYFEQYFFRNQISWSGKETFKTFSKYVNPKTFHENNLYSIFKLCIVNVNFSYLISIEYIEYLDTFQV